MKQRKCIRIDRGKMPWMVPALAAPRFGIENGKEYDPFNVGWF